MANDVLPKRGLLGLTLEKARKHRWEHGRAKHGGDGFDGHPLIELDRKLVDALGCIGEAHRQGFHTVYLEERLFDLCEDVRELCWYERVWERKG